jgi:acyl dehydratase
MVPLAPIPRSAFVSKPKTSKTSSGNFFEDFRIGQVIRHATPRTVTSGDVAVYQGIFGPRFAVQSSDAFAQAIGYRQAPLDDLLVFHMVFGKTVPDLSLNAVANLGYADCRFLKAVYPGTTLNAVSEVVGLRENANHKTGIVYVRSKGFDESGDCVLDYVRWVMVRKRDEKAPMLSSTPSWRSRTARWCPTTSRRRAWRSAAPAIVSAASASNRTSARCPCRSPMVCCPGLMAAR